MKLTPTHHQLWLSVLAALAAMSSGALAADGAAAPDTSKWTCETCAFEGGWSGEAGVGAAYATKGSRKFGEYNGLSHKGGYALVDGDVRYNGSNGYSASVLAESLGLSSRSIEAQGGKQGQYRVSFGYDGLEHLLGENGQSPYLGVGTGLLTRPGGVAFRSASTAGMPLASTLQNVDLHSKRQTWSLGGVVTPVDGWSASVNSSRELRSGLKAVGASFFANSSLLPTPTDYTTDKVDAAATYTGKRLQATVGWSLSSFRDKTPSMTWENAFLFGPDVGQMGTPPGNTFQQVHGSVSYAVMAGTQVTADAAFGRMRQDVALLPTSGMPSLWQTLPRDSLDARVKTTDLGLRVTTAATDKLRLNLAYAYNDRDNETPTATWPVVTTDLFAGTPTANTPYSFTNERTKLGADYKLTTRTKVSFGFDQDNRKRPLQEVERTRERTLFTRFAARTAEGADLSLKVAHAVRTGSGYNVVSTIQPAENPLLRKFNLANRTRDTGSARGEFGIGDATRIGLGLDASSDEYSESVIGLTRAGTFDVNGDVSVQIGESSSVHLFASHQEINSTMVGSVSLPLPGWTGKVNDRVDFFGIGGRHSAMDGKLELAADYASSRTRSKVGVFLGTVDPSPFPDVSGRLDSYKLSATYKLRDNLSLLGSVWHERYTSANWALDGVQPGTVANLLALGQTSPRYRVNVISVSTRYRF